MKDAAFPPAQAFTFGMDATRWLAGEIIDRARVSLTSTQTLDGHLERLAALQREVQIEAYWCRDEDF